jgi:hypothetical protein
MGLSMVTQKGGALVLVERRSAPIHHRKIQQVLHSTFGYVQDDKMIRGRSAYLFGGNGSAFIEPSRCFKST